QAGGAAWAQTASPYADARRDALISAPHPQAMAPPVADVVAPQDAVEEQTGCVPQPFGQSMFAAAAGESPNAIMSPQQRVAPGDRVLLAVWGAIQTEEVTAVDSQGFIY